MDLIPGTLLKNRYRILSQLGQGGMGAVYLAEDTALEQQVAVKANTNPSRESTAQFLREARLLAALRHSNLPRVIDYFVMDANEFLVMDYIPGEDLSNVLEREGQQPLDRVLGWATQLGSALSYLHQQNPPVIHRDVKPANIKLMANGEVSLVDFGIAKTMDTSQKTAAGASGYTPGFAPPEQYGGLHSGPYSDQFSFAATLYALLTGESPADSIQRVLGKAELKNIRELNPAVPHKVANAVQRGLSIRPEDRFSTIAELVQAMTELLSDDPSSASAETPAVPAIVPPSSSGKRGNGWIIGLGVGGVLVVGVFIAAVILIGLFKRGGMSPATSTPFLVAEAERTATLQPARSTPVVEQVSSTVEVVSPESSVTPIDTLQPTATPTLTPTITATPVPLGLGGVVAFISNRGDEKILQIWTMQLTLNDSGIVVPSNFNQLTTSGGDKTQPVWSPDGKSLLYVAPGGVDNGQDLGLDIWKVNADGSEPVDLSFRPGDDLDPAWSPDGQQIAFSNNGRANGVRQMYLMGPDGSEQTRVSEDFTEYSPTWSPDQKWLAFVWSGNNLLVLWRRDTTDPERFKTPRPFDPRSREGRLGSVADPAWSPDGNNVAYTRIDGVNSQIYTVTVPVSGQDIVITPLTSGRHDQDPAWSPDSRWVLYTSNDANNQEINIVSFTGQLTANLTNDPAVDMQPAWQPRPTQ